MRYLFLLGLLAFAICDSVNILRMCFTKIGPKSISPVKTTTYSLAITLKATKLVTNDPASTITLAPQTVTSIITSTVTALATAQQTTNTTITTLTAYIL